MCCSNLFRSPTEVAGKRSIKSAFQTAASSHTYNAKNVGERERRKKKERAREREGGAQRERERLKKPVRSVYCQPRFLEHSLSVQLKKIVRGERECERERERNREREPFESFEQRERKIRENLRSVYCQTSFLEHSLCTAEK